MKNNNSDMGNFESRQSNKTYVVKKVFLVVTGLAVIGTMCILSSCFSSTKEIPHPKQTTVNDKNNIKEFTSIWNKTISEIKYRNTHLKIDFDTYKLGEFPENNLKRLLFFDKEKLLPLKIELESKKYEDMYSPVATWIDRKINVSYTSLAKKLDSDGLMLYVSKIVTPERPFSRNTIDAIIQLNSFCYYFDRNKEKFYRKGYDKNIKNCQKIEKLMIDDGIKYEFK